MDEFSVLLKKFETPDDSVSTEEPTKPDILVIDDDESMRRGLTSTLTHKYTVTTAESGKQGIEILTEAFHCVILDVKMQDMNGFETYPRLKEKCPSVPIVFFTAFQSEHDLRDIINKFKPEGYVEKGKDISFLEHLIENAIKKYHLILENEEYKRDLEKKVAKRTAEISQKKEELEVANKKLSAAYRKLEETQAQIIQQSTLYSLGRVASGMAHNLRTPVEALNRIITEFSVIGQEIIKNKMISIRDKDYLKDNEIETLNSFFQRKYCSDIPFKIYQTDEIEDKAETLEPLIQKIDLNYTTNQIEKLIQHNLTYDDIKKLKPYIIKLPEKDFFSILSKFSKICSYCSTAKNSVNNIADIINAIGGATKGLEQHDYIDLNLKISEVLVLFQNKIKKHKIAISTEFYISKKDNTGPIVCVQHSKLFQIFENLISNALFVLRNQKDEKKIIFRTYKNNNNTFFEIEDNGPGIDKNNIQKIFEPFYSTKSKNQGQGLGLWTVHSQISEIGEIRVDSIPGKTKFTGMIKSKYCKNS